MTVKDQAEGLISEAWQFTETGSCTQKKMSVEIALWCAKNIASHIGFSPNDEYWIDVINYLRNKLK